MSNKTPVAKDVKIKSEPSRKQSLASRLVISGLFLISAGLLFLYLATQSATLTVNNFSYNLLVSRSVASQQKGLGGRQSIPTNEGMLFVFPKPIEQCFWMKDMHFPLDMIWLSPVKKVVYIETNVQLYTYPESFCPTGPSKYVIELNAGQVNARGIKPGQTLVF